MLATNLTELIWNVELKRLLRLCHTDEYVLEYGSDYDRFVALCKSLPLLMGHTYPAFLSAYLREHFGVTISPKIENADKIWQTVADRLLEAPMPVGASGFNPCSLSLDILPTLKTLERFSVLEADTLLDPCAKDWNTWKEELQLLFLGERKHGTSTVRVLLTDEICRQNPSKFHVDMALKRRASDDRALLTAQLVRFFAEECQRINCRLLLELDACENHSADFLCRMERAVGLPSLYLIANNEFSLQNALLFAGMPHKNPIFLAVKCSEDITKEKFEAKIKALCCEYPLGNIRVIDGNEIKAFKI